MKIYVDKNALQDYTTKLIAKEKTIFATKNEVGSPLVASTVAEMTNQDKVYVYVGSETGYTSGNWYYYNGSAWVSGGVYNATAFVTDTTLTQAGMAADAKVTGDDIGNLKSAIANDNYSGFADIPGKYVKSDGTLANNNYLRCSDFIAVPAGAVTATQYCYYTRPSDSVLADYNPLCVFYADDKTTIIDYIQKTGHVNGYKTFDIPIGSKFVRFNISQLVPDQSNVLFRFNGVNVAVIDQQIHQQVPKELGYIGHYTGTFSAKESLDTGIKLEAGKTYHIVNNTVLEKRINVYRDGAASDTKSIYPQYNYVNFTNGSADGDLMLYNSQSNLDAVDIDVYVRNSVLEKIAQIGNVYVVSKSNLLADFTSVTDCFLALKDDNRQKTIYIDEGEYDIFQEYIDAEVPVSQTVGDFWDYCVWTPNNSHIIGRGRVSLKWMPDPSTDSITVAQCDAVSPLNVSGNVVVENLEVYCKNGRYCIHNDTLQQGFFSNAIQKYINIRCYKLPNDTSNGSQYGKMHTIGFGLGRSMHFVYDHCQFYNSANGRAFYGHTWSTINDVALTEVMSGEITVLNSVLDSGDATMCVKLGNVSNQNLHVPVLFSGCYFSSGIYLINENTDASPVHNAYDVTMIGCNDVPITISDTNNQYPVKRYNIISDSN